MVRESKNRQLAQCRIRIDNAEIDALYPFLRLVSVETSRRSATVCRLHFDSLRDAQGAWNVQDSGLIAPWRRICVEAVFGSAVEEIMRGFIRDVSLSYPGDMQASVTVTAQDESLLLDREHIRKVFSTKERPLGDDALVRELLKPHWLGRVVEASAGMMCGDLNHDGTPIRLLLDRAEANGYEFFVREGRVYFGPPDLEGTPQAAIVVYGGRAGNCLHFSLVHDGHKPDEVRLWESDEHSAAVSSAAYSGQLRLLGKEEAASRTMGLGPFVWSMDHVRGSTAAERQTRVRAKADECAWKLSARGELDGSLYGHVLQTHRTVVVDGIGPTYGGLWYVDEVKHDFSAEGYRQAFTLIRNAIGGISPNNGERDALAGVRQR